MQYDDKRHSGGANAAATANAAAIATAIATAAVAARTRQACQHRFAQGALSLHGLAELLPARELITIQLQGDMMYPLGRHGLRQLRLRWRG